MMVSEQSDKRQTFLIYLVELLVITSHEREEVAPHQLFRQSPCQIITLSREPFRRKKRQTIVSSGSLMNHRCLTYEIAQRRKNENSHPCPFSAILALC